MERITTKNIKFRRFSLLKNVNHILKKVVDIFSYYVMISKTSEEEIMNFNYRIESIDRSSLVDKFFVTGGFVRDILRGEPSNDIDYCCCASEEEFEAEFPDFKKVYIDNKFPVYLDSFGNEFALTRTEESTGPSDKDFVVTGVGVPIEKDLFRRDFSACSLAMKYSTGEIIDVVGGQEDIHNKILRTINDKFIIEDPNRAYRLARFAATLKFSIDPATAEIVKRDREFIKTVTTERVQKELQKAYKQADKPSVFFKALKELGILDIHFDILEKACHISAGPNQFHFGKTVFDHLMDSFDRAKEKGHSYAEGIASLFHDVGKILSPLAAEGEDQHHYSHEDVHHDLMVEFFKKHRFEKHVMDLSLLVGKYHMRTHVMLKIKKQVKLIRFYKAIKRNVDSFIKCCDNDHELNEEQVRLFALLKEVFNTTEINIPKEVHNKGNDAVISFVENCYVQRFKELIREEK